MNSIARIVASTAGSARMYSTKAAEGIAAEAQGHFKVTQTRSIIGLPKSTIKVLKSLGLGRRIGRPVFQPHDAATAGKLLKVKEVIKVENMPGPIPPQGYQRTRATKGYTVVGKM
ncbi:hypothetical protein BGW42_003820 [Actinomortierella wolfii]|nr:hypothetical protein BGW42_003820 [Actinomortierella wolfii]